VRTFAAPAVLALLATRLNADKADLVKLVATDPLTGLFNRRYFSARLQEEVGRALRYGSNLTLLALDIDLFKSVNDRFGHAAGDAVLHGVAGVLKNAVRFFDVCARLGGDEFMILLHGSETNAIQSAHRLLTRIEGWRPDPDLEFPPELRVTVSIGLASLTPDSTGVQDLMTRADRALYAAKAAGRNCVRADG
jgi:diguanylate cyclase (GGDEF)-like protein